MIETTRAKNTEYATTDEIFVIVRCPACHQRISSTVKLETHNDGPDAFHCPHCYSEIVYEPPHFKSHAVSKGDWRLARE